jgi:hypothetical protein
MPVCLSTKKGLAVAEPVLSIVKFEEQMTLKLNENGATTWVGVMNCEQYEALKKGLHKEHEIDIARMILASAFPGDDEETYCEEHGYPDCEVC